MDNPFQSSVYEPSARQLVANNNVPTYDFYSSAPPQQPGVPSGSLGGATSPTIPHFGLPENFDERSGDPNADRNGNIAATAVSNANAVMSHPVWTWKFWQSFFDVDTGEVLRRIFLSFFPYPRYLKSESVEAFIGAKPDLYGPFWIGATLVFIIAVLGNIASYFQHYGQHFDWSYDFNKVSAAAITVFIYVWVVPLVLWTVLWWLKMNGSMKLAGALCVYGYSMFLYIPVSFLWLINIDWVQWASALTAAALTGFILSFIFWNHLHYSHRSAAYIIGLVVFCGHLALGFGFVMYFFHYPRPVMPVYNATTPVMSESLFTERRHTNFTQAASSLVLSTSNARGDVEISNETSALVLTTTGSSPSTSARMQSSPLPSTSASSLHESPLTESTTEFTNPTITTAVRTRRKKNMKVGESTIADATGPGISDPLGDLHEHLRQVTPGGSTGQIVSGGSVSRTGDLNGSALNSVKTVVASNVRNVRAA